MHSLKHLKLISKSAKFLAHRQIPISIRWNSIDFGQKVPDQSTKELLDILGPSATAPPPAPGPLKEKLSEIFGTGQKSRDPPHPDEFDEDYIELGDVAKSADFQPIEEWGENAFVSPAYWFHKMVESCHENLGISVGMAIFGSSLLLKLLAAPLYLKSERYLTAIHNNKIEISTLQRNLRFAYSNNLDKNAKKEAYRQFIDFRNEHNLPSSNYEMLKLAVPNVAIMATQVVAVHRMAQSNMLDMMSQKFAWIAHLGAPDVTYVLPLVSSICFFSYSLDMFLRGYKIKVANDRLFTYGAVLVCGGFSAVFYTVLAEQPAVVVLCLATNLVMSRFYVNMLKTPVVRKFFGLPELATHSRSHISVLEGRTMLVQDSTADYNKKVEKVETLLKQAEAKKLAMAKKTFKQRLATRLIEFNEKLINLRSDLSNREQVIEKLKGRAQELQANREQAKANISEELANYKRSKQNLAEPSTNQNEANVNVDKESTNQNKASAAPSDDKILKKQAVK